ncbi:MAB_1171c family putative transporter [Streptomyces yaizuensis]|uniref:Membrane protein n=1 Tax=Streptomyces yaizuensis TaxID=2989713 RepID=A0ABQ5P688_9ACTN|nr:MAB_1171c family putative transporter [Streptomyces sp. YSPA8]GLF98084.1 membrane protein [Streptomyces sp. YSPA8]
MNGTDYYIPSLVLGIALLAKAPTLWRGRRDPMLSSVLALLCMATASFALAAPPTIRVVNETTGVPNVSAPLVYSTLCAVSCATLILIIHWRGGPAEALRRRTRAWMIFYGCLAVSLFVLFALGDAPVERLQDLDTYYATTPFIREMIVAYLGGYTIASMVITVMCWLWAREVRLPWLRRGLYVLVTGFVLSFSFAATKLIAVGARWAGHDLDFLSTSVAPPLAGAGAVTTTAGFLIPLLAPRLAPRWASRRAHHKLAPLAKALNRTFKGTAVPMTPPRWRDIEMRATLRESQITDHLLQLAPYLDIEHREAVYQEARGQGRNDSDASVIAAAVMVRAALAARDAGHTPTDPADTPTLPTALDGAAHRLPDVSQHFARLGGTAPLPSVTAEPQESAPR